MATEHSTYTYEGGMQETVTLKRGIADPHGHALLRINYSDGRIADCYVNTAWLRDRLNDLGEPRPLTPDAITDEMVERGFKRLAQIDNDGISLRSTWAARQVLEAALTEPPARPEGAEEIEAYMRELVASHPEDHYGELADHLASRGVLPPLTDKTNPVRVVGEERS